MTSEQINIIKSDRCLDRVITVSQESKKKGEAENSAKLWKK